MLFLAAYLMRHDVDWRILAAWIFSTFSLGVWAFLHINRKKMVMRAFRMGYFHNPVHRYAVYGSIAWAAPFWFQGWSPSLIHSLTLWPIALFVMMTFALLAHSIPLACILFILPVSLSATLALLMGGDILLALLPSLSGSLLGFFCFRFADTYLRIRRTEESLRDKKETVSLLLREFETSADWLWQTDAQHHLVQVSPRFANALGGSPSLITGMPFLPILNGGIEDDSLWPDGLRQLAEKLSLQDSFANFTVPVVIGGERRWWQLSAAPRRNDDGHFIGFRGVGSDVTEQYNSAKHIARLARVDALTGLPNRLSLQEALGDALRDAGQNQGQCALLMIDLDRFKAVNDTLGHPTGDKLLSQVAERLLAMMDDRMSCGRLGGDEFAVVVRDISSAVEAEECGRSIIASLSRPYMVDGHQLFVGVSVGFGLGPQDGATVETLTRNADLALYQSKDRGGNCTAPYVPMLHAQAEERRLMEQELRAAMEKREFQLYYQPVVNAKSETLVGFEALLRWNSAKLGSISPARFIPIAEESRLIAPIGEWVLRTACHEAMTWPSHLKVAVNVSSEQLSDPNFSSVVLSALAQSGLPPHRLEIEVTESVFLRDGGGAEKILDQLLAIGVRLSLDDFGTGYSALGYLKKARFSTIKVDRSFVASAAKGGIESIAIIRAVVALADGLGMITTAEGTETAEEVETIRKLGCRNIQGYFYGRPMTPTDIRQYFPIEDMQRLSVAESQPLASTFHRSQQAIHR